ncbi:hypothetical protein D8S78_03965 [Natrialba swarupiae]|nr:hypothetical protein [Natrialba swarupiae]
MAVDLERPLVPCRHPRPTRRVVRRFADRSSGSTVRADRRHRRLRRYVVDRLRPAVPSRRSNTDFRAVAHPTPTAVGRRPRTGRRWWNLLFGAVGSFTDDVGDRSLDTIVRSVPGRRLTVTSSVGSAVSPRQPAPTRRRPRDASRGRPPCVRGDRRPRVPSSPRFRPRR